jgi:phage terminase large subunit-like protein
MTLGEFGSQCVLVRVAVTKPFDRIVQSYDTANKATELSDYSVCTTWGIALRAHQRSVVSCENPQ